MGLIAHLSASACSFSAADQVALVAPEIFGLRMPPEYYVWLRAFDWMSLNWFHIALPAACVGNFRERLELVALGPLVPLGALVLGGALFGILDAHRGTDAAANCRIPLEGLRKGLTSGILLTLPLTLATLFALLSPVSARIFSTFSCEVFHTDDDGASIAFLQSDYAVECGTAEHDALIGLALHLIVLWPLGVPAVFWSLLLATHRSTTTWARALDSSIGFLKAECAATIARPPLHARPFASAYSRPE